MSLCYDLMVTTDDAFPDGTISYGQGYYGSAPIGEYSVGLLIDGLDICSDIYAALTDVDGVPSFEGCVQDDYEGMAYFLTGDVGDPGGAGGNNDGGFLPSGFLPGQNLPAQTITLLLNLNWDAYLPEGEHAVQDSYYLNIDPVQDWVDGEAGPVYDPILTTGGELGTCTDSEPDGICDGAVSLTDLGQKVQDLDIAGTTVGDILAAALDLLENGNDPQDVHSVSLSAGDLTAILGLINESYEALIALGHSDSDARHTIERAVQEKGKFKSVDDLLRQVYTQQRDE